MNNAEALAGYARDRIFKKNRNVQQVFIGETGSGKTYSSASFTHLVDPGFFDSTEKIVFTVEDFFHQIQTLHSGDGLVLEEAGVLIGARNFQSKINKMVGMVNQTFRHRNLCVSYTVPSMKFFEMQVRDLMHAIIHMQSIDYDTNTAYGRCYKVSHDPLYGKTYLNAYEFTRWDGGRHVIDIVGFNPPPKKWLDEYEKMKTDFTQELYEKFEKELSGEAAQTDTKLIKLHEKQAETLLTLLPKLKQELTWNEIRSLTGIPPATLRRWLDETE